MKDKQRWEEVKRIMREEGDYWLLGPYYSHAICNDIKHLGFTLSRYKFVSKLLAYRNKLTICELGCQEALGALMLEQNTDMLKYVGIDIDERSIQWNANNIKSRRMEFIEANLFDLSLNESFDAVVSLDVIEHIDRSLEDSFCQVAIRVLDSNGVFIVGTPNEKMSPYASEGSKAAHINLYDQDRLYSLMGKYFHNVFIFNMNDEIVNTGFAPMSCYIFAVCTTPKEK